MREREVDKRGKNWLERAEGGERNKNEGRRRVCIRNTGERLHVVGIRC